MQHQMQENKLMHTEEEVDTTWSSEISEGPAGGESPTRLQVTFDAYPFGTPRMTNAFPPLLHPTLHQRRKAARKQRIEDILSKDRAFPILPATPPSMTPEVLLPLLDWIFAVCIFNFDLDKGQTMQACYPPLQFSAAEAQSIAFASFPDSNSYAHNGDATFSFRLRQSSTLKSMVQNYLPQLATLQADGRSAIDDAELNDFAPNLQQENGGQSCIDEDGYTYGYVFFRQKADQELRRGYFQKSLVILTVHPWSGLFLALVKVLGPLMMDIFISAPASSALPAPSPASQNLQEQFDGVLQSALCDIARWPTPPNSAIPYFGYTVITYSLHFLGRKFNFSFPPNRHFPQVIESAKVVGASAPPLNALSHRRSREGSVEIRSPPRLCNPAPLYELFASSLDSLWLSWELMVIGEPILVVADSPKGCSQVVLGLVELIKPVPFGGDYRPYFTIQDPDIAAFTGMGSNSRSASRSAPHGIVLGVTNQIFDTILEHWPHIMRVSKQPLLPTERKEVSSAFTSPSTSPVKGSGRGHRTKSENGSVMSRECSDVAAILSGSISNAAGEVDIVDFLTKTASGDACVMGIKSTTHKPYLTRDRDLMKGVVEAALLGRPVFTLNNMIRNHFIDLSTRFLQPLNRYFESLIEGNVSRMDLSTLQMCPRIQPFIFDAFSRQLESSPPSLPVALKRPILNLYASFCKSCNFVSWLHDKMAQVHRQWKSRYFEIICGSDLDFWTTRMVGKRKESVCIDMLCQLRAEVAKNAGYFTVYEENFTVSYIKSWRASDYPGSEMRFEITNPADRETFFLALIKAVRLGQSVDRGVGTSSHPSRMDSTTCTLVPTCEQFFRLVMQTDVIQNTLARHL